MRKGSGLRVNSPALQECFPAINPPFLMVSPRRTTHNRIATLLCSADAQQIMEMHDPDRVIVFSHDQRTNIVIIE